jgi:hypothetical protein
VQLGIQLPRSSEVKAGRYEVRLKVVSKRDPSVQSTVEVALDVEGFLVFDVDLRPRKARGRKGSYHVGITNSGNVKTTYTLAGQDRDEKLQIKFKQDTVVVEPGATVEVPLVVKPKKAPIAGRPKKGAFSVTVTPQATGVGEAKPRSVEGQLECLPKMPIWAIAVAAVAAIAILAIILVFALSSPPDKEAPTIVVADLPWTDDRPVTLQVESDADDVARIQILLDLEPGNVKECESVPCVYTTEDIYPAGTILNFTIVARDESGNENRLEQPVEVEEAEPKVEIVGKPEVVISDRGVEENLKWTVEAVDDGGADVQTVEIYARPKGVGKYVKSGEACSALPCEVTGGPFEEGVVEYYAEAVDANGKVTTTIPQEYEIVLPPVVIVEVSPPDPTTADTVTFLAKAKDFSGIDRVEIFFDNVKRRECKGIALNKDGVYWTCSYSAGPFSEGDYEYFVLAHDPTGDRGSSGRQTLTVSAE